MSGTVDNSIVAPRVRARSLPTYRALLRAPAMAQPPPPQGGPGDQFSQFYQMRIGSSRMDERSAANKAASNVNKTVGKVTDRTKVIYVKATGDGVQKVWPLVSQSRLKYC
jgi:hypothetical protein